MSSRIELTRGTQHRDADLAWLDPVDVIEAQERVDREMGALVTELP